MEHYYNKIQGWFDYEAIYDNAIANAEDGAKFVEVGAWKGKSIAYAGVELLNSGKAITLYAVDHFLGSEEHRNPVSEHYDYATQSGELRSQYLANIEPIKSVVKTLDMQSVEAAKKFKKASLDLVFIDGSHDFESVCSDIETWLPKIKPGGVLAGHDYDFEQVSKAVNSYFAPYQIEVIGKSWSYTLRSVENGKD